MSGSADFATPVSRVDNAGFVAFNQPRSAGTDDPVLARLTLELVAGAGNGTHVVDGRCVHETTLSFAVGDTRLADSAPSGIDLATYDDAIVSVVALDPS